MTRNPHVLVIPFAAQGHVAPLMKLALQISAHGVRVTVVNPQSIHDRVMASLAGNQEEQSLVNMVSFPDALEREDDRMDDAEALESMKRVMPGQLKNLIQNLRQSDADADKQITCVIADVTVGWILEVPEEMGINGVAFSPAGPASLALTLAIPEFIQAGILGDDGTLIKGESIRLSDEIPPWRKPEIPWSLDDQAMQKSAFEHLWTSPTTVKKTTLILSNTFHELDPSASKLIPNILPIGPLVAANQMGPFAGNFWPEDPTCLSWLDKQNPDSVIYVAFGSTSVISPHQLHELAIGLELTSHPFLWVVRSNLTEGSSSSAKFPEGFTNRVADRGKIVEWAPQEKVLAHPSIGCFVSHCGWNSTLEGLSNGVPFLCWPYFSDQLHNKNYICDVWKIGLALAKDDNGIITRDEITTKIKSLISSDGIKASALRLKEMARHSIHEDGSSFKNFESFIERIKSMSRCA